MPATTFTSRLGLRKPDPDPSTGDFITVTTDINASMDKIDAAVGKTICTSGTRPTGSDRWDGREIYETDTRRSYMWSAAVTNWLPLLIGRGTDGPYLLGQSTDTNGEGINVRGSAASADVWRARVTSDANSRHVMKANGDQSWGPGSAGTDLTFGRTGSGIGTLGGSLVTTGGVTVGAGGGNVLVRLQETVIGTPTSTVTLSSIPSGFRSIKIVTEVRVTTATINSLVGLRFNNDTTANYNYQQLGAFGTTVSGLGTSSAASKLIVGDAPGSTNTAGKSSILEILIPNITGTTFNKKAISQEFMNSDNQFVKIWGGWWGGTAALTRIDFMADANNLETGTVVTFYGIP
jgi:hypothetical protein